MIGKGDAHPNLSHNTYQECDTSDEHHSPVKHPQDRHCAPIAKEDTVQDKDSILLEHTDEGEHDVGEENYSVENSIQEYHMLRICYIA